jgi:F-type H+-transporting ATPase subunit epsilon
MAATTFNFELVTPERLVFAGEAQQVVVPGAEGDFAVLAGHSPFISTLRPGILDVTLPQGRQQLLVKKGVAEADPERLTVLAQTAVPVAELTGARLASELQLAEAQAAEAKDDHARMMADTLLDVLKRLQLKSA